MVDQSKHRQYCLTCTTTKSTTFDNSVGELDDILAWRQSCMESNSYDDYLFPAQSSSLDLPVNEDDITPRATDIVHRHNVIQDNNLLASRNSLANNNYVPLEKNEEPNDTNANGTVSMDESYITRNEDTKPNIDDVTAEKAKLFNYLQAQAGGMLPQLMAFLKEQEIEEAKAVAEAEAARFAEEMRIVKEAAKAKAAADAKAARIAEEMRTVKEAAKAKAAVEAEAEEEQLAREAKAARIAEEMRLAKRAAKAKAARYATYLAKAAEEAAAARRAQEVAKEVEEAHNTSSLCEKYCKSQKPSIKASMKANKNKSHDTVSNGSPCEVTTSENNAISLDNSQEIGTLPHKVDIIEGSAMLPPKQSEIKAKVVIRLIEKYSKCLPNSIASLNFSEEDNFVDDENEEWNTSTSTAAEITNIVDIASPNYQEKVIEPLQFLKENETKDIFATPVAKTSTLYEKYSKSRKPKSNKILIKERHENSKETKFVDKEKLRQNR